MPHANSNELMDFIREMSDDMFSKVTEFPSGEDPNAYAKASVLYFALRGRECIDAVEQLCQGGFSDQAKTVARSVIEMGISAAYMWQDPENRGVRFADFEAVAKMRRIRRRDRQEGQYTGFLDKRSIEAREKIEKEYELVKAKWQGVRKDSWSGLSIAAMADACDLGWLYEILYADLCDSAHNAVHRMQDYYRIEDGPVVVMSFGENQGHADTARTAVVIGQAIILRRLDTAFGLEMEPAFDELERRMHA